MASIAPFIFPQYFDNNGNPLSGGKIYAYAAGTTTPQNTYSDAAGTVPNTNPIILSSSGRTKIFLQNLAYDFVIKNSLGVTIDTILGVGASSGSYSTVSSIAQLRALASGAFNYVEVGGYASVGDGGGGLFYWDSSSTTADDYGTVIVPNSAPITGRWKRLYTGPLNVLWFGPTDGASDYSATLNRSVGISNKVEMPGGSYVVSSTVTKSGSTDSLLVKGDGTATKVTAPSIAANPAFHLSGMGDIVRNETLVRDINFDAGTGQALKVTTVSPFIGQNLRFNTGANAFRMSQSFYGRLTDSEFKVSGIWFDNVNNFQIQGVDMNGGADWTGSQSAYSGRFALTDYAILLDTCTGITFANMTMESWYTRLLHLVSCKKITFDGVWFEQNRGDIVIQADLCSQINFENCLMDFFFGAAPPYPTAAIISVDNSSVPAPNRTIQTVINIKDTDMYLTASGVAANNYYFCKALSGSLAVVNFDNCTLRQGFIILDRYTTATVKNMLLSSSTASSDTSKMFETLPQAFIKEQYNSWVPSNASANWDFASGANLTETTTADLTITTSTTGADVYSGSRSAKVTVPAGITTQHTFSRLMSDMGGVSINGQTFLIMIRFKTSSSIKMQIRIDGVAALFTSYEVQTKVDTWTDYVIKTDSATTFAQANGTNPRLNFLITNNSGSNVDILIDRIDYAIVRGDVFLPENGGGPASILTNYNMTGATISGLTASQAVFTDANKNLVSVGATGTGNVVRATSPTIDNPTISNLLTLNAANYPQNRIPYMSNGSGLVGVTANLQYDFSSSTFSAPNVSASSGVSTAGNLSCSAAGGGLAIKTGSNARTGSATLVAGTITIANTSITANTKVFYNRTTTGGTVGHLSITKSVGVGFTINSTSGTDTSVVDWLLVEGTP